MQFLLYRRMKESMIEIAERRSSLLAHDITLVDTDTFGRVSFGLIKIRGKLLPSRKWRGRARPYFQSFRQKPKGYLRWKPVENDELICSFDVHDSVDAETRFKDTMLLQISTWKRRFRSATEIAMALLLLPVEAESPETYCRVGVAEVPNVDGLAEDGWEVKDVCII